MTATTFAISALNGGKDAWFTCGHCGGYLGVLANYDRLPIDNRDVFGMRAWPLRLVDSFTRHVCPSSTSVLSAAPFSGSGNTPTTENSDG